MSFIILLLIFIMLYASLTKYGSLYKLLFMTFLTAGMTTSFLLFGLKVFKTNEIFVILNTEMSMTTFIHTCIIWYAADIIVFIKMLKNHRSYLEVNSSKINAAEQEQE